MELGERAKENSWILISFLIGFYGNWFVTTLDKLALEDNLQIMAVVGSFIVLFAYLLRLTSTKKTPRLTLILGLIHILFIYLAILIEGTEHLYGSYTYVGGTLWMMVSVIQHRRL